MLLGWQKQGIEFILISNFFGSGALIMTFTQELSVPNTPFIPFQTIVLAAVISALDLGDIVYSRAEIKPTWSHNLHNVLPYQW